MADFEQRIKQIKTTHKNGEIEKAKAEERMKTLEEQKSKIIESCNALGVDPESLATEIEKETANVENLLKSAEESLGITETEESSPF